MNESCVDNNRPTWVEYFKEIVQVTAKRSPCERLHVGCILIKDNRIIFNLPEHARAYA